MDGREQDFLYQKGYQETPENSALGEAQLKMLVEIVLEERW
jgi:hypothetical protein